MAVSSLNESMLRGGVTKNKRENLGQCPDRGGGKKKQKCPNFNLGIFKTGGGSLFFKNVSFRNSPQTPSELRRINLLFWYFLMQTCLFLAAKQQLYILESD